MPEPKPLRFWSIRRGFGCSFFEFGSPGPYSLCRDIANRCPTFIHNNLSRLFCEFRHSLSHTRSDLRSDLHVQMRPIFISKHYQSSVFTMKSPMPDTCPTLQSWVYDFTHKLHQKEPGLQDLTYSHPVIS